MVANLTTRNKRYKDVKEEMYDLAVRGQEVKDRLCRLVDEDTEAFNRLLDAFRMPKGTEKEEAERAEAIAEATKSAALVPFDVMERSLEAISLAKVVAEKGLAASSSDAGVAALMARAAVHGAHLNVLTNLKDIEDRDFAEDLRAKAQAVVEEADRTADEILAIVRKNVTAE
jgi:glutamate formiminotransferase/formiminotetrahydrofolate cyclodeaminase